MSTTHELRSQVLQLSVSERAALVRDLILSLESQDYASDWDAAWNTEIEQRSANFRTGRSVAHDWQESLTRLRAALQKRPAQ